MARDTPIAQGISLNVTLYWSISTTGWVRLDFSTLGRTTMVLICQLVIFQCKNYLSNKEEPNKYAVHESCSFQLKTGNRGFWDQNLALHWVKRNIASFGGDPDKITVFGESAGGWSVNYQLVSDQSKGLFNAAIIQSGPLLASYQEPAYSGKTTKEIHQKYAEQIGCGPGKEDTVIACLRSKTPEEIIKLMFIMHEKEECSIGR